MRGLLICLFAGALGAGLLWLSGSRSHGESVSRSGAAATTIGVRCTDVWIGPDQGDWARASNWSTGAVPAKRSQACIPRGINVIVSHGRNRVWGVEAGGGIVIRGGALLLMGSALASEVADLGLAHAALGGPGKLIVTRRMFWGPPGRSSASATLSSDLPQTA